MAKLLRLCLVSTTQQEAAVKLLEGSIVIHMIHTKPVCGLVKVNWDGECDVQNVAAAVSDRAHSNASPICEFVKDNDQRSEIAPVIDAGLLERILTVFCSSLRNALSSRAERVRPCD